ncbi:MAG: hypothetical protein DRN04_19970, partial [Thermoprotei archaeon]
AKYSKEKFSLVNQNPLVFFAKAEILATTITPSTTPKHVANMNLLYVITVVALVSVIGVIVYFIARYLRSW